MRIITGGTRRNDRAAACFREASPFRYPTGPVGLLDGRLNCVLHCAFDHCCYFVVILVVVCGGGGHPGFRIKLTATNPGTATLPAGAMFVQRLRHHFDPGSSLATITVPFCTVNATPLNISR